MSRNDSGTEERIDRRLRRACEESMTVVPVGGGEFDVYSGTAGVYRVDIATGECDCPDQEHNVGAGECKHALRVELEAGLRDVPLGLRPKHAAPTDVELAIAGRVQESQPVALADGGMVAADPQGQTGETCDHPDCQHGEGKERPVLCWDHWEQRQEARR